jgi:hypothetical protein
MKQKAIDIIKDRVLGPENDLKSFVYIRKNRLQHQDPDNLGGGNIVAALSLFTMLNFLGKSFYCVKKPDKFDRITGEVNETETFVQFYKYLHGQGVDLGLPTDGSVLDLVWKGFRNYLAHLMVPETGKASLTFQFDEIHNGTIAEILDMARTHKPFEHDGSNRNWRVNCDVLLAWMPKITEVVTKFIEDTDDTDIDLLKKVVGFE